MVHIRRHVFEKNNLLTFMAVVVSFLELPPIQQSSTLLDNYNETWVDDEDEPQGSCIDYKSPLEHNVQSFTGMLHSLFFGKL